MPRVKTFEDTFTSSLKKLGYRVERSENGAAFIFKEGFWGWIEFKQHRNSKARPGQKENVEWANENSWGSFVHAENKDEVLNYLKEIAK